MTVCNSSKIIHELMYLALIDMREESIKFDNKITYHLSDLFHVVPKMLIQVEKGEIEYKEVLDFIKVKASDKGVDGWLQSNIDEIDLK